MDSEISSKAPDNVVVTCKSCDSFVLLFCLLSRSLSVCVGMYGCKSNCLPVAVYLHVHTDHFIYISRYLHTYLSSYQSVHSSVMLPDSLYFSSLDSCFIYVRKQLGLSDVTQWMSGYQRICRKTNCNTLYRDGAFSKYGA